MYTQQPYAQPPYPLHDQKQTAPDRLPVYTRRGFATFIHLFFVLGSMYVLIGSIRMLILGPDIFENSQLKELLAAKGFVLPPPFFFAVRVIEYLVVGVTSILAIATPKFLNRKQRTVFLFLLPSIITTVLDIGLACYYLGLIYLVGLPIHALIVLGMLQGSKDNILASIFVPFRKQ